MPEREQELLRALWATAHALGALSKRMERRLGVTAPQRLVLRVVAERPGISAGQVASAVGLHPSTVTGILRRLEDRGHLQRAGDDSDRRRSLFVLTPSGRELDALRKGTVEAVVSREMRSTPSSELDVTVGALNRLARALAKDAARKDTLTTGTG